MDQLMPACIMITNNLVIFKNVSFLA